MVLLATITYVWELGRVLQELKIITIILLIALPRLFFFFLYGAAIFHLLVLGGCDYFLCLNDMPWDGNKLTHQQLKYCPLLVLTESGVGTTQPLILKSQRHP